MTDVRIVPLDPRVHDRKSFSCGRPTLDRYLREQASQDIRARVNAVFVMTPRHRKSEIAGFFTLCGVGIDPGEVPEAARKRLPRYPQVSATLLGQFAVASTHQGQGLGGVLLVDALTRAYLAANEVGSTMVVTDPLDEGAREFYAKYGFTSLEGVRRMFLMMKTIERMVERTIRTG